MTLATPRIGDVLMVQLPYHDPRGHEQEGPRPVVVVGLPERAGVPRSPMLLCLPLSSQLANWPAGNALYPRLARGSGGLPLDSVALVEHLRGIDVGRVRRYLGALTPAEFAPLRAALQTVLAL